MMRLYTLFLLFLVLISVVGIVGWCLNISALWQYTGAMTDKEAILRIVGIFLAPLGSLLGYFYG